MNRLKDYIISEILDTVALMQLNGTVFPEMSSDIIESLADSIYFEWEEIGDPEEDLTQVVKWNIEQFLIHG
jgi:hypothetical protein